MRSSVCAVLLVLLAGCLKPFPELPDADGDGFGLDVDCNDEDPAINPDTTWYTDADGDGFGAGSGVQQCEAPANGVLVAGDCDDALASVNPGATEVCDGVDQDCDDVIDDGTTGSTWYGDADGDGFGDPNEVTESCTQPEGTVTDGTDCNDALAAVNPGAAEICDVLDNDCDGVVDDDATDGTTWYADADGDGFGVTATTAVACEAPSGFVRFDGDCDDGDVAYHPSAPETDCSDPNDYNCDGFAGATDSDGDGFAACEECDDGVATVFPGATEVCDAADNDCDGVFDESDSVDASTFYPDGDHDGFGDSSESFRACYRPNGAASNPGDCDDTDVAYFPGAPETDCTDPNDYDCSGDVPLYADADGDGTAECQDCDDADPQAHPGGVEVCDGADNDCDGLTDDADTGVTGQSTWYTDADHDGFGTGAAIVACAAPANGVALAGDCDDTDAAYHPSAPETDCADPNDYNCDGFAGATDADGDGYAACEECDDGAAAVHPGAVEVCNGADDDCDGRFDVDAADATTWYADADRDGVGDSSSFVVACDDPAGTSAIGGDCDDSDPLFHPGAAEADCTDPTDYDCSGDVPLFADTDHDGIAACVDCDDADPAAFPGQVEVCDGADNDCDGLVDDADPGVTGTTTFYADRDHDGFGRATAGISACNQPAGYAAYAGDCDDDDATYHPGADESDCSDPNDYNCDGSSGFTDADADGFAACEECDDADAAHFPGADETCDGADDDCDGVIDEPDAIDATTWYADADADGSGDASAFTRSCTAPAHAVGVAGDCDDGDPRFHPGASETDCADPNDYDCSGTTPLYADADGDGFAACDDCDDADLGVHPGAVEICDGADDDCDGLIDDADPFVSGQTTFYADGDGDGYGRTLSPVDACNHPSGTAEYPGDCNDSSTAYNPGASETDCTDPNDYNCDGSAGGIDADGDGFTACEECDDRFDTRFPGAPETCDRADDDCDGLVDEDAIDATTWYADVDRDGTGNSAAAITACRRPSGAVGVGGDCDDRSGLYHPGAAETDCTDPNDYDCSGSTPLYSDADHDGTAACLDCSDTDASRHPGAVERCNGADDDCDGLTDDADAFVTGGSTWFADADSDGYGRSTLPVNACAAPVGYVALAGDCNDASAAYNPAAAETDCSDPADYNCDGSVGFADADADGFAACQECNDSEADAFPGADELCDGIDDDCDGQVDESGAIDAGTWYADADADGAGNAAQAVTTCDPPPGAVGNGDDCDDTDPRFHPGAVETCTDPNDYDCDGSTGYADVDGDGFAACDDCNDADYAVHPGAAEVCDGADDDCNGLVDDADPFVTGRSTWYRDADADGYGLARSAVLACSKPSGTSAIPGDCNDALATYHPGADESDCADPNDYNCDGSVGFADADADGFAACAECDDAHATRYPGAAETCDLADDDCDGLVDESDAIDAGTWYSDLDRDGFGDSADAARACVAPAGTTSVSGDCDDRDGRYHPGAVESDCSDPNDYDCSGTTPLFADDDADGFAACDDCDDDDFAVHPGATELCDGVDNDCDGLVDDADPFVTGTRTFFVDGDHDGYGRNNATIVACAAPSGTSALAGDCDDASAAFHPGADESDCTDPADYNCDGSVGFADSDGDGFAACEECDDTNGGHYPGATETCDGGDDDCDGAVDESDAIDAGTWYVDGDRDGSGNANLAVAACNAPSGTAAVPGDCDDADPRFHPGAAETDCTDPNDYDCSGSAPLYGDADFDGTPTCRDCNDRDAAAHPGATETCDAADNDCDGKIDDADPSVTGQSTWYTDADADGYGRASSAIVACFAPNGTVAYPGDCNDASTAYHPSAPETNCADPNDYNCDGSTGFVDRDADGFAACAECDDNNAAHYPGAAEHCNGVDDDCDTNIDELDAVDAITWYLDGDHDGYGTSSASTRSCNAPSGTVATAGDCNDADARYHPGASEADCSDPNDYDCSGSAPLYADADADGYAACDDCDDLDPQAHPGVAEICDGADNDCDGLTDDADSVVVGQLTFYVDTDGDGYGTSTTRLACSKPTGYAAYPGDCDDTLATYHPGATETNCADPNDYNCDGAVGSVDSDGDGFFACQECDDADATVHPGATERCNGVDDDCDSQVDEAGATGGTTWYADADRDGHGSASGSTVACTAPAGTVAVGDDCDDTDPRFHPGASEADCTDPLDYDCSGSTPLYADADGDGTAACRDCDDADAGVWPGATEICDGDDNDCDGLVDDADAGVTGRSTWYADGDGDGYGRTASTVLACSAPFNYTALGGDCRDTDPAFHPSAPETNCADPNDYNCDGQVGAVDGDGDGYVACLECDDANAQRHPGAAEKCNAADDDCDGSVDEAAVDAATWYDDGDRDGYGDPAEGITACTAPAGSVAAGTDCDDTDPRFHPGAAEACTDPYDYDCNGSIGFADSDGDGYADCLDCGSGDPSAHPGATEVCDGVDNDCDGAIDDADSGVTGRTTWYADGDADSYGRTLSTTLACNKPSGYAALPGDCNDASASYHPNASETNCADPNDYNCDGATGFTDGDADGFAACEECDDGDDTVFPGSDELCDGVDDDCDGQVDEADAVDALDWYTDADHDGFGDPNEGQLACAAPSGTVADDTDCDDTSVRYHPGASETDCTDPNDYDCSGSAPLFDDADDDGFAACVDCDDGDSGVHPGALELCDGVDNDCDGDVDDADPGVIGATTWYSDADDDGYGLDATAIVACFAPTGYAPAGGDCDDTRATFHPNALEASCTDPNDYNCDGSVGYADADQDGFAACSECDDSDATHFPGAVETCDGADDDCDGQIDEAGASGAATWYADADRDGSGDNAQWIIACNLPFGYAATGNDCNDADARFHPGASEADCTDPNDYNCSGSTPLYADGDSDGYAACVDCNDANFAIHPGATEVCDAADNDCDAKIDDADPSVTGRTTYYTDADHDTYGLSTSTVLRCTQPANTATFGGDCNDASTAYHPNAPETNCADPNDYNCDGQTGYVDGDGDGFAACAECDDASAAHHPGATELCNGADDDCDALIDESDAANATNWYTDGDNDGHGAGTGTRSCAAPSGKVASADDCRDTDPAYHPGASEADCTDPNDYNCSGSTPLYADRDGDGYAACVECDDNAPATHPGALETCDGLDNDCDNLTDDADPTVSGQLTWYTDADADGYGLTNSTILACFPSTGKAALSGDCNDASTQYHPGAAETCTDVNDYNCDGSLGFVDRDGDTYAACAECDDNNPNHHPGATEVCNGADDDCDGLTDETGSVGSSTWYLDADHDGYGKASTSVSACGQPSGYVANSTDCNDASAGVNPGAAEICDAGNIDQDCDGLADDADTGGASGKVVVYTDGDGDTYGRPGTAVATCDPAAGSAAAGTDCNDTVAAVNPGATEVCDASDVDEDCNGLADDADPAVTGRVAYYADADADGFGNGAAILSCSPVAGRVLNATDCNDASATISPSGTEVCDAANVDEDCDTKADDADTGGATGKTSWYADSDADGYGRGTAVQACDAPSGRVANSTDCLDTNAAVHPGAAEICDPANVDEDCDGTADDADPQGASGKTSWYADADADSYGAGSAVSACDAPSGRVANNTDCNDAAAGVNPGATETCDGSNVDEDCDGSINESGTNQTTWYRDQDGDNYGVSTSTALACAKPAGYAAVPGDCDDTRATFHPGATETCSDPNDYDCSGGNALYVDADADGSAACLDCNDADAAVHPGATERCDSIDNDCDSLIDDADTGTAGRTTWYVDADNDLYGTSSTLIRCVKPAGYAALTGDCNDASTLYHPGASETSCADPNDYNCDGHTGFVDSDGDTYAACAECDDSKALVHPGATEACNGYDDDCDGLVDEAGSTGTTTWYADADADGYGNPSGGIGACTAPTGRVINNTDCNDANGGIHPGAQEVCDASNVDEDCDTKADDLDTGGATGKITTYADADADGFGGIGTGVAACDPASGRLASGTDCNDAVATINPAAAEVCDASNVDEDCDGTADDLDSSATGKTSFYADGDTDGYGAGAPTQRCDATTGVVALAGDCNDANAAISPGDPEICDASDVDEDCDGFADDADSGGATGKTSWYADADADGFGGGTPVSACNQPSGRIANGTDCNDTVATTHPGGQEVCDAANADEDCDGLADNADSSATGKTAFYTDGDADGYGAGASVQLCDATAGKVAINGDCNDANAGVSPSDQEICDPSNVDEDCDGTADDLDASVIGKTSWYADGDADTYGAGAAVVACDAPSGRVASNTDCNDAAAAVNPGATEICDVSNVDQDCDGAADDADPQGATGKTSWYADADADTYGAGAALLACDQPGGRVATNTDCNDAVATIHPGGTEVCDASNVDEDCDGQADDADTGGATGKTAWYTDADNDGYGTGSATQACDRPAGKASDNTDCNDTNAGISPGDVEICDASNVDEDCDTLADDNDPSATGKTSWYADGDGDGYGSGTAVLACEQPSGRVANNNDCNDGNAGVGPGGAEVCDGANADEDCDGLADDLDPQGATGKTNWYTDADNDTYGAGTATLACDKPAGKVATNTDCNDAVATVHPGGTEVCDASNLDEDCDGLADNNDPSATGKTSFYVDADSDGYGAGSATLACDAPAGHVANNTDCNDVNANVSPGDPEVCDASNVDEDCDGLADDADSSATGKTSYYADSDGDGYGAGSAQLRCDPTGGRVAVNGDCNDASASINPGASEVCDASNVDEDCDGLADNNDPSATGKTSWYADGDSDTYGAGTAQLACDAPSGRVAQNGDCNDANAAINPGASEVCDASNLDEDCDGLADNNDPSATGKTSWYADVDGDSYGAGSAQQACDAPSGRVASNTDCDDTKAAVNPGATEVCDASNVDEDCDGNADDLDTGGATGKTSWYADGDADTYGAGAAVTACDQPSGRVASSTDCDDTRATVHPGGQEVCDAGSLDEDCDGLVNSADPSATGTVSWYADADNDGYGTGAAVQACDAPSGRVAVNGDCNDANAAISPGDPEVCDASNVDEDCDGNADDADVQGATGKTSFYTDGDGDGFGAGAATQRCDATAGKVADNTDCNDANAAIKPTAQEVCDAGNVDEDCDGNADDADTGTVTGKTTFHPDADADTYGDSSSTVQACDAASGRVVDGTDCDDTRNDVHPGGQEVCDGNNTDEDCDGLINGADPNAIGSASWYVDADNDGYGTGTAISACSQPSGRVGNNTDCNDANASISPGDPEVCDASNVDEDCDGVADDVDPNATGKTSWYADADGDGFGTGTATLACEPISGKVANNTDCNDASAAIKPTAQEVCDASNVDEDCDGLTDDADSSVTGKTSWYADADSDGYGTGSAVQACDAPSGRVANNTDCNDANASISPGDPEVCDLGTVDEDCDGLVNDADPNATGKSTWYTDNDNDGYGTGAGIVQCAAISGRAAAGGDCDDTNANVSPGDPEVCDASDVDEDCDGNADDADLQGATGQVTWYVDGDGDGYGGGSGIATCDAQPTGTVSVAGDCNDAAVGVHPGAAEVCDASNVDEDCDGNADDADTGGATGKTSWYTDADNDGYGTGTAVTRCDQPSGRVGVNGDCNDGNASVSPGDPEVCDASNVDEDCDGNADDLDTGGATGKTSWYADNDNDGFGVLPAVPACDKPTGYVATLGDCNDNDPSANASGTEVCDASDVDEDCDGLADDLDPQGATGKIGYYVDADGDGFGAGTTTPFCDPPSNQSVNNTDCDDTRKFRYPGAIEICDGVSDNCSGTGWLNDNGLVSMLVGNTATDLTTAWSAGTSTSAVAQSMPSSGSIEICNGTFYAEISVGVAVTATIESLGGKTVTTLSGDNSGVIINAAIGADVTIEGLTLRNGRSTTGGAVHAVASTIDVIDCTVIANHATDGAGIWVDSQSTLLTTRTTFQSNIATDGTGLGGGIFTEGAATWNDVDSYFVANTAGYGGGVFANGNVTMSGTEFDFNKAKGVGAQGAVGGGLFSYGTVDGTDVYCHDNFGDDGTGMYLEDDASLVNSSIQFNNGQVDGGGIWFAGGSTLDISGTDFRQNTGNSGRGGALLVTSAGAVVTVSSSTFRENFADRGGAIYADGATVDLESSTRLYTNSAGPSGGAVYLLASDLTCTGSNTTTMGLDTNDATTGGGVYLSDLASTFTATSCDMGSGATNNTPNDVATSVPNTYGAYGTDATFTCSNGACSP
jgi:hypothetical protein